MGFSRFVGYRVHPSIVMLTPTGWVKIVRYPPGDIYAVGSGDWFGFPLLVFETTRQGQIWCQPVISWTPSSNQQNRPILPQPVNTRQTCKSAELHLRCRVPSSKVDTVFICPFGGIFPIKGHLEVVYTGINSDRKQF